MSLDQLEATIMALPKDERRQLAQWFYKHEHDLLDIEDDHEASNPEVKAELDRRWQEIKANPSLAVPITDEWFDQLEKRFASDRAGKTPAV
jgi:putative addiction module component (TIGR02574 family)